MGVTVRVFAVRRAGSKIHCHRPVVTFRAARLGEIRPHGNLEHIWHAFVNRLEIVFSIGNLFWRGLFLEPEKNNMAVQAGLLSRHPLGRVVWVRCYDDLAPSASTGDSFRSLTAIAA